MKKPNDLFAALDRSIQETAARAKLESRVYGRVRGLLRENGLAYGYSEKDALKQAMIEVRAIQLRR